jgi:hypothetical protein
MAEFKGLSLRALRQQARALGVAEATIEAAVEGEDPRQATIALIKAAGSGDDAPPAAAAAVQPPASAPGDAGAGEASAAPHASGGGDGVALETLPAALMAALEAVEAVETASMADAEEPGSECEADPEAEGSGDEPPRQIGVPLATQLGRTRQSLLVELRAALRRWGDEAPHDRRCGAQREAGEANGPHDGTWPGGDELGPDAAAAELCGLRLLRPLPLPLPLSLSLSLSVSCLLPCLAACALQRPASSPLFRGGTGTRALTQRLRAAAAGPGARSALPLALDIESPCLQLTSECQRF